MKGGLNLKILWVSLRKIGRELLASQMLCEEPSSALLGTNSREEHRLASLCGA